jgi:hypothetical protein
LVCRSNSVHRLSPWCETASRLPKPGTHPKFPIFRTSAADIPVLFGLSRGYLPVMECGGNFAMGLNWPFHSSPFYPANDFSQIVASRRLSRIFAKEHYPSSVKSPRAHADPGADVPLHDMKLVSISTQNLISPPKKPCPCDSLSTWNVPLLSVQGKFSFSR